MFLRTSVVASLALAGCGGAPRAAECTTCTDTVADETPAPPGIALSVDLRGRRITVDETGVLNAEGCSAARYDWRELALLDLDGRVIAAASVEERIVPAPEGVELEEGGLVTSVHAVRAPDRTLLAEIDDREVRLGDRVLLHFEDDGALFDGATPLSTSSPTGGERIPTHLWRSTLALLMLVGLCWETSPRSIPEP